MIELIGRIIRGLDDEHHGGVALLKAPPRHAPIFDDVALNIAGVAHLQSPVRIGGTDWVIDPGIAFRQQHATAVTEGGKLK